MTHHLRWSARAAAAVLLAGTALPGAAAAAGAAPTAVAPTATVTVDRVEGLPVDEPTQVQVTGTGFQSVTGGFGGVYVLFGWVDDPAGGTWRPSVGGVTGADLRYAVDDATRENEGRQVFVSFPGSTTAVEANGGTLGEDGSFSAVLTVPGARFPAVDDQGGTSEIDCTQLVCGVLTIGAHGVENANNETFTPVTFGAPAAAEPTPEVAAATARASATPSAESTPAPVAASDADASSGAPVVPVVVGAVVLLALVAAVLVLRRRRPTTPTA